jgi:hypothetical protein
MGYAGAGADRPQPGREPRIGLGVIGEAWGLVRQRMGTWVLAVLVQLVCLWVINTLVGMVFGAGVRPRFGVWIPSVRSSGRGGEFVQAILTIGITGFFLGGMVRMAAKQLRGQMIRTADLFEVTDVLPNLLLASYFEALAISVGMFFCAVPGLIVGGLLMLMIPLVVDARIEATAAFSRSWHALKGQWFSATVVHVVAALLAASGGLCCVGILFTAPIYAMTISLLYRDFFGSKPVGPGY